MQNHSDHEGDQLGMWLFLYGEMILFSGLFLLYAVYLSRHPAGFLAGGSHLDVRIGGLNTVILLISSFCVAAAITAIRTARSRLSMFLLGSAITLAAVFLVNKYFEWSHKIHAGLYPGGATLEALEPGEKIFFGLYYVITGLHGVHVLIGGAALITALVLILKKKIQPHDYVVLDNIGLYWHLVDLVWIFVFPLFYLIV